MKKLVVLFYLFCASGLVALAQANYKESIKFWDEGPLTVQDFSTRKFPESYAPSSNLSFGWVGKNDKKKIGNLVVQTMTIRPYMDKLNSWINPAEFYDWTLRYNQTMFDMAEMVARRFAADLRANPKDAESISDFYRRLLSSTTDTFCQESKYGRDSSVVYYYEAKTKEQLSENAEQEEDYSNLDDLSFSWGLTMYGGFQAYMPGANLSDYVNGMYGADFGLVLSFYKRFNLAFDLLFLDAGNLKKGGVEANDYNWKVGEGVSAVGPGFLLSYRAINKPYYAFSPMIGFGSIMLRVHKPKEFRKDENDTLSQISTKFGLRVGAQFDYKIRRKYRPLQQSYGENTLALKVYASHDNYEQVGNGWAINAGLTFNMYGWGVKYH